MNAFAVISDSGTLPEESCYFTGVGHPFPAVCIRTSTERPEALEKGNFVLAGIDRDSILQAAETAVTLNARQDYGAPVPDYTDENVSMFYFREAVSCREPAEKLWQKINQYPVIFLFNISTDARKKLMEYCTGHGKQVYITPRAEDLIMRRQPEAFSSITAATGLS